MRSDSEFYFSMTIFFSLLDFYLRWEKGTVTRKKRNFNFHRVHSGEIVFIILREVKRIKINLTMKAKSSNASTWPWHFRLVKYNLYRIDIMEYLLNSYMSNIYKFSYQIHINIATSHTQMKIFLYFSCNTLKVIRIDSNMKILTIIE